MSDGWTAFACDNGASSLTSDAVRGRWLFDFIDGMEVRSVYRALFETVRVRRRPACVSLRCDSPSARRLVRLEILPGPAQELELSARLERAEPRISMGVVDPVLRRPRASLELCSFCKRAHVTGRGWLELDELGPEAVGLAHDRPPELRQSICEPCAGELGAILDRARAA